MLTKYEVLADRLTDSIAANLKKGVYKLPTEAALCRQYHVSRQTVRQALMLLQARGLITTRQGSGSYATGLSASPDRNTIGMLVSSDQEYIYPELIADIRSVLSSHGFTLKLFVTEDRLAKERELLQEIAQVPPRGLIVEGCRSALPNPNLDLYEQLHRKAVPILFLHEYYRTLPWAVCIRDDNFYGGYLLAQHLYTNGHTEIAAFFRLDSMQGIERYQGFTTYLRDMGYMAPDDRIGWFTGAELEELRKKQDTHFLLEFIQKQVKSCSAIVCHDDETAYWLVKELQYTGIRVPHDVSVVSFGNSYLSELSGVRITSLAHKPHEMGTRTAECMLQALRGIPPAPQELSWEIIVRESDSSPEYHPHR